MHEFAIDILIAVVDSMRAGSPADRLDMLAVDSCRGEQRGDMRFLAIGFFVSYMPYALLTRALSGGLLPGVDEPVGGLVLLPAAAIGQLLVMPLFLGLSGWWRFGREQRLRNRRIMLPGRDTVLAALFMAVVVGTTTLNFTFLGASLLFMLLLMRAGVLIMSPIVDRLRRRAVHVHAWVALGFSLLAVVVALGDVDDYRLRATAVLSLCGYLAGYVGRFQIMSRVAKTGVREIDRRYFAEEHAMTPVFLVLLCALGAALGQPDLQAGFSSFLTTPGALYAAGIGVLYEALFIVGTLIYLDVRGYAWCVPVNRVATLFSGLVASYVLVAVADLPPPGNAELVAVVFIVGAVAALSYPALRDRLKNTVAPSERMMLYVCCGNRIRSVLAECITRGLVAAERTGHRLTVASAGVKVRESGAPMTDGAYTILREMGHVPHRHRARPVTAALCRRADVIYCMTAVQRVVVISLAPEVAERTHCLAPYDLPEPFGTSLEEYRHTAALIQRAVQQRLAERNYQLRDLDRLTIRAHIGQERIESGA